MVQINDQYYLLITLTDALQAMISGVTEKIYDEFILLNDIDRKPFFIADILVKIVISWTLNTDDK